MFTTFLDLLPLNLLSLQPSELQVDGSFIFPVVEDKNHGVIVASSLTSMSAILHGCIFKIYPDNNHIFPLPTATPLVSAIHLPAKHNIISFSLILPFSITVYSHTVSRVILLQCRSSMLFLFSKTLDFPILFRVKAKIFIMWSERIQSCYFSNHVSPPIPYFAPTRLAFFLFFKLARHNLSLGSFLWLYSLPRMLFLKVSSRLTPTFSSHFLSKCYQLNGDLFLTS